MLKIETLINFRKTENRFYKKDAGIKTRINIIKIILYKSYMQKILKDLNINSNNIFISIEFVFFNLK